MSIQQISVLLNQRMGKKTNRLRHHLRGRCFMLQYLGKYPCCFAKNHASWIGLTDNGGCVIIAAWQPCYRVVDLHSLTEWGWCEWLSFHLMI